MDRELLDEKFKNLEAQITALSNQIKSWQSEQGRQLSEIIIKVKTIELSYLSRKEVIELIENNNNDLSLKRISEWGLSRIANEKLILGVVTFLGVTNIVGIILFIINIK